MIPAMLILLPKTEDVRLHRIVHDRIEWKEEKCAEEAKQRNMYMFAIAIHAR